MTVEILIKFKNMTSFPKIVPIATHQAFEMFWKPLFQQLELTSLAFFDSGTALGLDDIEMLVKDLEVFRENISSDQKNRLIDRVNQLINELHEVTANWNEIEGVYI